MLLYEWLSDVAAKRGSDKALVYRDTYLSWRGLIHRVDRRTQELAAMGIGKGAWVGLMLGNVPDLLILSLAPSRLEAATVPLDPTTGHRELELILEAAPLRALVTRPRGGESSGNGKDASNVILPARSTPVASRPVVPVSKFVPESRRRLQGTLLGCNLYKRTVPDHLAGVAAASVHFTGDVGGDPKGVVRTDAQIEAVARVVVESLDISKKDHLLCAVPLHHAYGFDFALLPALRQGATLFLEDEVSPKRIAKILREHEIDVFPAAPALLGSLARVPTVKPLRIGGARYLSSGSRLPDSVAEAFAEKLGVRPLSCYHSTEAGPIAIDRLGKGTDSVGKPMKGVEVRVSTGNGTRIASGAPGPVWIRSKAMSTLFVPKVHMPARDHGVPVGTADRDGWLRTGDVGSLDKAGRLSLSGREDDLVKVDGKRVALGEVEGCLESFPKVKAAQARVVTDDMGGPMVVARVVRSGACKAEEIIDHCARNLAPYKVPRQIEFCETLS